MAHNLRDHAFKVAALYFVVAGCYVVASGYLLSRAAVDPGMYFTWELVRGLGFVVVTSGLLYWLAYRHFGVTARAAGEHAEREQELRQSRDQLTAAQHIARLGSWEADLVTGALTWSEEVYRIFGIVPEEFGRSVSAFFSYVHPEDREALIKAQQRALAGEGPLELEHRIVRPGGEIRYVLERAEIRTDGEGHPSIQIGTVQDITERKRAELELSKRNRQQAAIAELGLEALRTSGVAGLMERAMAAAAAGLDVEYTGVLELMPSGHNLRLVTGFGWPEHLRGELTLRTGRKSQAGYSLTVDAPVAVEDLCTETRFTFPSTLLDLGLVSAVTAVIHGEEGPWGVVSAHTTRQRQFTESDLAFVQAVANLIGDVLQREQAINVARERNVLRQMASEVAALGGWAYDRATGTLSWSEEVARIHEVPPDYVTDARQSIEFYAPEYRKRMVLCFEKCLREGIPYDEEMQLVTGLGRRVWVRVIGKPHQDREGNIVGVHGAIQDISERKRLETMLQQSQRLEAFGQLTGGIAHDFNNLLTVIVGNSDELIRAAGDDAHLRQLALTTHQAARRGAELTGRLLAYARKQPLAPQPTDVALLLEGMGALLRRTLGEHVEIHMVREQENGEANDERLWTAMVDPSQLESAILNLCLNARDAMPDGGRLTLETGNVEIDGAGDGTQDALAPGQYVTIAVTDSGDGVDPELVARVFEPFFTTKPAGQGSGLGLSMVYGFAKQSRGHVQLCSDPGRGTTVKLYLPRTSARAAPVERPDHRGVPRGTGERILVVEDDDLVRQFVADQVAALGYQVLVAANGSDALTVLRQRDDVDLLFTDVVMPGSLDGRQLADAARELQPALPVLFTSGYTESAIVHHGRLDPDVALLNKPYRLADLARKLAAALGRSDAG